MTTYIVTEKSTGTEVYRYQDVEPIQWNGMEFDTHDHTLYVEPAPDGIVDVTPKVTRLTKLAYMNRFHDDELAAIYSAAKVVVQVEVWLAKFNATTPDPDGTSIDLRDERTIGGLQALEAAGLIGPGRAAEILA